MRCPSRVRISNPKRELAVSKARAWLVGAGTDDGGAACTAPAINSSPNHAARTAHTAYGHQKAVRLATPGSMAASRSKASTAIPPGGMPR
ncbi:hypothetical protein D3C71_1565900 [compost metagenome]